MTDRYYVRLFCYPVFRNAQFRLVISHDLICLEAQHSLKLLLIHAEIMLQTFPAILFPRIILKTVPLSTCHTFSLHKGNEERLADGIL